MTLARAAAVLDGTLHGADAVFTGVNSDTRKVTAGELFVALKGPNFDGHDFLAQARERGAVGALVSDKTAAALSCIEVDDTRLALGRLAADWRRRFEIPVIAVTGSNGKTTVKNMIAAILAETGPGLATQGNLNNDIGLPLTLLRLREGDRHAVIEMGMNHAGEIDYLTRLARPTVAVINNAGEAHLAGLGSVENVARAKGEIFAGLDRDGVAVINADDAHAGLWRGLAGPRRTLSFGLAKPADVTATFEPEPEGNVIHLTTTRGNITMRIALPGRHNVMNAMAAAAATLAAGAQLEQIRSGLEKLKSISGRLELKRGLNGARVLDDTYNANPASLGAGLDVLRGLGGERVLVMGDMAELGPSAADLHHRVGELARTIGIERLFAVGELSRNAVEGFGRGAQHFAGHEALIDALRACMNKDMTVLVKGSRVMQMERVVAAITRVEKT